MSLTSGFILGGETTAKQFSGAFHALTGDGLVEWGSQFQLKLGSGFNISVGTGFALVAGHWLSNDAPVSLRLPPAGNYGDRFDAVAIVADEAARQAFLTVLEDVSPKSPPREEGKYAVFLYLARVRRGAATLYDEDITDTRGDAALCGSITPLSAISGGVLNIYEFLTSGIDREVARIIALFKAELDRGEKELERLNILIGGKMGNVIGDVVTGLSRPGPEKEWLLCNGGMVPLEYMDLRKLTGGTLPDIRPRDRRFKAWIYAGAPEKLSGAEGSGIASLGLVGYAIVGKEIANGL